MSKPRIALVGAPNSGKTTLYNWLTASRYKTVNYPGSTVEIALGDVASHLGEGVEFMDTPGVYSLLAKSADEEVTHQALFEGAGYGPADGVLILVDGTQVERQMFLVEQIRQTGLPFAVVVTMSDLLRKQNVSLRVEELRRELKADVLLFEGLLAGGLKEIVEAAKTLARTPDAKVTPKDPIKDVAAAQAAAKRLSEILLGDIPAQRSALAGLVGRTAAWDRWLLHPIFGLLVFILIMGGLFTSIFWLAAPAMDFVDGLFSSSGDWLRGAMGEATITDFTVDGMIAGFAAVLVFAPQIFILFIGVAILEGSGYLARAATLIDKPFSAIGLSGRSFVPILSGFSCAVPAMMATRNISSARDRWITNFIIPLMSCSARLPVYALLLAFLFRDAPAWKPGLALAALYFASLLVGAAAAAVLNRFLPQEPAGSLLMMELPLFRRPRTRVVLRQAFSRTWSYVRRSGPIIFVIAMLMWVGTTFPRGEEGMDPSHQIEQSYAGRLGHFIEPAVEPLGVDWRVGVGLISAFAAREVFVSTLAVTFNITDEDEEAQSQGLLAQMQVAQTRKGEPVFTTASVWGLLVFFMIALQCMSTFAVARRESGSWKFAVSQVVVFNLLAYVAAAAVVALLS